MCKALEKVKLIYIHVKRKVCIQLGFFCLILDINSSDGESSSEGDEMPWQQIWLSSDSDIDYDALRRENNW